MPGQNRGNIDAPGGDALVAQQPQPLAPAAADVEQGGVRAQPWKRLQTRQVDGELFANFGFVATALVLELEIEGIQFFPGLGRHGLFLRGAQGLIVELLAQFLQHQVEAALLGQQVLPRQQHFAAAAVQRLPGGLLLFLYLLLPRLDLVEELLLAAEEVVYGLFKLLAVAALLQQMLPEAVSQ